MTRKEDLSLEFLEKQLIPQRFEPSLPIILPVSGPKKESEPVKREPAGMKIVQFRETEQR